MERSTIQKTLSFDDVLIKPARSSVLPTEVQSNTSITSNIKLGIPLISSAMDTVTEYKLAIAMAQAGEVKILGVTYEARVDAFADAPTMKEQGIDTNFVNWRGFFAAPGLTADKLAAYQEAIDKMYATPEWEAVRARNGWVNIHNPGDKFQTFLEGQEKVIGDLMKKLGFL